MRNDLYARNSIGLKRKKKKMETKVNISYRIGNKVAKKICLKNNQIYKSTERRGDVNEICKQKSRSRKIKSGSRQIIDI